MRILLTSENDNKILYHPAMLLKDDSKNANGIETSPLNPKVLFMEIATVKAEATTRPGDRPTCYPIHHRPITAEDATFPNLITLLPWMIGHRQSQLKFSSFSTGCN